MPVYEIEKDGKVYEVDAPDMQTAASAFGRPQQENTWGQAIKNVGDGAAKFATGIGASVVGNVAGLGALAYDDTSNAIMGMLGKARGPSQYADPSKVRENVSQFLTYQPNNPESMSSKIADAPGTLIRGAGQGLSLATGTKDVPYLGTIMESLPEAAANYGGMRAAMGPTFKTPQGRMPVPAKPMLPQLPQPPQQPVPTTEQLHAASSALYKAADDAGVVIKPESTAKAAAMIRRVAEAENLGKLPPKLKEAHDVLVERAASGKPLSLKDADKARGLINDAAQSLDAGDRRLAAIVKSGYDDFLNNLGPADTLAGAAAQGVSLLKDARALWTRKSHSETLDAMQRNAEVDGESKYTQAGTEHALRNEFKKLYKSDDAQRFMTPEQLAAVRKVAAPGAAANALRNLGKMDPSRGGMAATMNTVVGGGIGAGLGALVGGIPGAAGGGIIGRAALGTAANVANALALRGTKGRVAGAREALVGHGLPQTPMVAPRSVFDAAPAVESLPFTPTPGVMPARSGVLSRGIELAPEPVPNQVQLPPTPARMTADVPPPMPGGMNYRPQPDVSRAGDLSLESPAPKYPGVVDFTTTNLAPKYAEQMSEALTKSEKGGKKKGLFDSIEEQAAPATRPARELSSTQIKLELQRLLVQMKSVPPGADALYAQGLKRRWDELQGELNKQLSRESSGGATSPRPTR